LGTGGGTYLPEKLTEQFSCVVGILPAQIYHELPRVLRTGVIFNHLLTETFVIEDELGNISSEFSQRLVGKTIRIHSQRPAILQ